MPTPGAVRDMLHVVSTLPGFLRTRGEGGLLMRRVLEYWERPQQLADRCARGGALCTASSPRAIPYRRMAFLGQKLPTIPSIHGGLAVRGSG